MNPSYECPKCGEWIEILESTPEKFSCPWCKEPLRLSSDAEFEDGMWHDLSRLVTARSHWDENYQPAPDEMRDAYKNESTSFP